MSGMTGQLEKSTGLTGGTDGTEIGNVGDAIKVLSADMAPANGSITAFDTATISLAGANGQTFYTGTPTTNSAAVFALSSTSMVVLQLSLIGVGGTVVVEVSGDGGTFWTRPNVFLPGTQSYSNAFTAPFIGIVGVAGKTHIRARGTTSWAGTGTITVHESTNTHSVIVSEALPPGANAIGSVTVSSSALPTGAATDTNQVTQTAALQILDDVPAAMNGAFSKGSPIMGQLDDTSTTAATEDNVAPVRITAQRSLHTNLRATDGTANPFRPDAQIKIAMDSSTLFYDTFDLSLDTTTRWAATGTAPTSSAGQLTISAGTTALAFSAIQSQPTFQLLGNMFNHTLSIMKVDSGLKTGVYRFWGLGIQAASPTVAAPLLDGAGFEWDGTTGVLSGVVWSSSTRSQTVSLSIVQPTDGSFHRYAVYYKTSRVYFEIDNVTVGSIAYPNPTLSILPVIGIVVNGASTVSPAATFISTFMGVGDTSRTNAFLSDPSYPWRKAGVSANNDLFGADTLNTAGQHRAQSVTTSAAEALGGGAILANRKMLSILPTNGTIYYGFSNAVTTTTGTPIFKNSLVSFAASTSTHVYVISAGTVDCRITEA